MWSELLCVYIYNTTVFSFDFLIIIIRLLSLASRTVRFDTLNTTMAGNVSRFAAARADSLL